MESAINSTCKLMKTGPLVKAVGAGAMSTWKEFDGNEFTLRAISHGHIRAAIDEPSKMRPDSILPSLLHVYPILSS